MISCLCEYKALVNAYKCEITKKSHFLFVNGYHFSLCHTICYGKFLQKAGKYMSLSPQKKTPAQTYFTSWDKTQIAYNVSGNLNAKHTILFVNGLFCTESYWVFLQKEFSNSFKIITFDLRGHQHSESPTNPKNITIEACAKDISALLEHLDIDNAIITGFSLGVQIVFQFYGLYPQKCLAIIAVTGSYENPLATIYGLSIPSFIWKILLSTLSKGFPKTTQTAYQSAFYLPGIHFLAEKFGATKADKKYMQPFYEHQKHINVPTVLKLALAAVSNSTRKILPTVKVPTLVIGGEKDVFTPLALSETMQDYIPNAQFLVVKGGTHTTLLEQPKLIYSKIKTFLTENQFS